VRAQTNQIRVCSIAAARKSCQVQSLPFAPAALTARSICSSLHDASAAGSPLPSRQPSTMRR
jgi:hypothetical protein